MHIHPKPVRVDLKRTADITDGPILPVPYSATGKKYRVGRVAIVYTWRDGEWTVSSFLSITLTGTVLKKDGSDSLNDARGHMYGETPGWLRKIVQELRPIGAPTWASADFDVEA